MNCLNHISGLRHGLAYWQRPPRQKPAAQSEFFSQQPGSLTHEPVAVSHLPHLPSEAQEASSVQPAGAAGAAGLAVVFFSEEQPAATTRDRAKAAVARVRSMVMVISKQDSDPKRTGSWRHKVARIASISRWCGPVSATLAHFACQWLRLSTRRDAPAPAPARAPVRAPVRAPAPPATTRVPLCPLQVYTPASADWRKGPPCLTALSCSPTCLM